MRALRKALIVAGVVIGALVVTAVATVATVEYSCRGSPEAGRAAALAEAKPPLVRDLPGYRRDQSSTYFTFPEWYIVYAAEDFGNFVAERGESRFRYLSSIAGFWRSFCTIKARTAGRAEPSSDVSQMIYTIGLSFSAEMAVKGLYETTFGRIFEWIRGPLPTAEDRFAYRVAQDYARFLYTLPWYKYPFGDRLAELWSETPPVGGGSLARKWERRAALSAEYAVKAGYAKVIQAALDAGVGEDARTIMMVVRGLTVDDTAAEPRIRVVDTLGDGSSLVEVPRYQVFSDIVVALSRKGRVVPEVAGNQTILLTAILPEGEAPPLAGAAELFSMPLLARPGWRRAGFDVRLDELVPVVAAFDRAQIAIEHLFDY